MQAEPGEHRLPPHQVYRISADFSMAIMMASAYEQIVVYGSGACLSYLQQQLAPPEEVKEGGKRKGQMVNKLKAEFFGSPAFRCSPPCACAVCVRHAHPPAGLPLLVGIRRVSAFGGS